MSILTDIGYRHSPSKINGWVNAPVKSIAEQMFNIKSRSNDKLKRGNVIEDTTKYSLNRNPSDEKLIEYIKNIQPDVDFNVNFECSSCNHTATMALPIDAGFFWPKSI